MDCRTTERRKWIVENYNVVPVAHIRLLAGQTKRSDAGQTIVNEYYIFHAYEKESEKREIIQCGIGAARDFLQLLGHDGLSLYNPLHTNHDGGVGGGDANGGNRTKKIEEAWNPIAKQLYDAIMWIIIIIDANPETPIFEIREKVYMYKNRSPFDSQIKAVNTIIIKNLDGRTLTEEIERLKENNDIRDNMCQFDMLTDKLNNYVDKDGNHVEIQSFF